MGYSRRQRGSSDCGDHAPAHFHFAPEIPAFRALTTLAPGPYSVAIGGGTGIVLAEIYEVLENNEAAGARRLVNVSARGFVSPATPFIAGFVITGNTPQRVLIRGVGPTLAASPFNVAGVLPNPQLTLFRGAAAIKTNDDWFRDPESALIRDTAVRFGRLRSGPTVPMLPSSSTWSRVRTRFK